MPTHLNSLVLDGATHVVREIAQQGDCWREIQSLLDAQPQDLYALLRQTLASPEAQITFCGAGLVARGGGGSLPFFADSAAFAATGCGIWRLSGA